MNTARACVQCLVKHLLLVVLLLALRPGLHRLLDATVDKIRQASVGTRGVAQPPPPDELSVHVFIATIAGLILAGAISGYTQFTFRNTIRDAAGKRSWWHILIGHGATGLQLFVIGVLVLTAVASLERYPFTSSLSPWPLVVGVVLYASMVLYDVNDFMTLAGDETRRG